MGAIVCTAGISGCKRPLISMAGRSMEPGRTYQSASIDNAKTADALDAQVGVEDTVVGALG